MATSRRGKLLVDQGYGYIYAVPARAIVALLMDRSVGKDAEVQAYGGTRVGEVVASLLDLGERDAADKLLSLDRRGLVHLTSQQRKAMRAILEHGDPSILKNRRASRPKRTSRRPR